MRLMKVELVKEIQKVIHGIDAKSLIRTNIQNLYLILVVFMIENQDSDYQI